MFLLLSKVFPEYEWLPWKFLHSPLNFWNDVEWQKKFVNWAGKELNIKEMSDWYKINAKVGKVWEKSRLCKGIA